MIFMIQIVIFIIPTPFAHSSCKCYYIFTPRFGFTPDANWPLIYAEKGIQYYDAHYEGELGPVIAMNGGVVVNAVCDYVLVTLKPDAKFVKYLKDKAIKCEITDNSALLMVRFSGKTAHASTPELGENAMVTCFETLGDFYKLEVLSKAAKAMKDCHGKSFGGYNCSKELGEATYSYGIVNYDGKKLNFTIDFRYGEEAKPEELIAKFQEATGLELTKKGESKLLIFDKKSPLVSTLMKAYKKGAHKLFAKPLAIGGGTYVHNLERGVAFGCAVPEVDNCMHGDDEFMEIPMLLKSTKIFADAILRLCGG